jgi:UDP-glucose 4-epimerase
MRVLVTGSSGTIGTRLCEALLDRGDDVIGVDRVPNIWQPRVQERTIVADLLTPASLSGVPTDVDGIVHLAANARVYDLVQDPAGALENVTTCFHTLEWARVNQVKSFIFASSRETYGNTRRDHYSEEHAHHDTCESSYSASKFAGEALVHAYRRCYGLQTVIFRFSNVYGMYDESNRVIPLFIRQALAGEALRVFGEQKTLDFTYIDDTVQGILQALDRCDRINGLTFNLGTGQGTSISHLANRICTLLGVPHLPIHHAPSRVGEITHYVADITRARTLLGYQPETLFDAGIEKAVDWYTSQGPRS